MQFSFVNITMHPTVSTSVSMDNNSHTLANHSQLSLPLPVSLLGPPRLSQHGASGDSYFTALILIWERLSHFNQSS